MDDGAQILDCEPNDEVVKSMKFDKVCAIHSPCMLRPVCHLPSADEQVPGVFDSLLPFHLGRKSREGSQLRPSSEDE